MISFNLQAWINNTNSTNYPAVGFKIIVSHFFDNMLLFLTDVAIFYQYSIWYHKIRMFKWLFYKAYSEFSIQLIESFAEKIFWRSLRSMAVLVGRAK